MCPGWELAKIPSSDRRSMPWGNRFSRCSSVLRPCMGAAYQAWASPKMSRASWMARSPMAWMRTELSLIHI